MDEQTKRLVDEAEARAIACPIGPYTSDHLGHIYAPDNTRMAVSYAPKRFREVATFIAHARTDVPALCAKVRELDAEVELLRRQIANTEAVTGGVVAIRVK